MSNKSILALIQDENPSYDPITVARMAAGIPEETLNAATDRVYYDGYYGPIRPDEWAEQDGRKPYTVSEAIDILRQVADKVDDYWDPEAEFGFDYNNRVDSTDIVKAAWPFLTEIYGGLPF